MDTKTIGRITIILLSAVLLAAFVTLSVTALATDPLTLFTDNILSSGPSAGITVMENGLLNRINTAQTSIDAAIYDFNRASVRDALIAARGRGVSVRVATDDEAYNNASYHPFYTALEAAGISVVRDNRSSIMHNKFFVIDGGVVWTGSTNISDNGFTYNHRIGMTHPAGL